MGGVWGAERPSEKPCIENPGVRGLETPGQMMSRDLAHIGIKCKPFARIKDPWNRSWRVVGC